LDGLFAPLLAGNEIQLEWIDDNKKAVLDQNAKCRMPLVIRYLILFWDGDTRALIIIIIIITLKSGEGF